VTTAIQLSQIFFLLIFR